MAHTLVEEAWSLVLDDDVAEEAPCKPCHGHGTDRFGEDCAFCGGLGVEWAVNRRSGHA